MQFNSFEYYFLLAFRFFFLIAGFIIIFKYFKGYGFDSKKWRKMMFYRGQNLFWVTPQKATKSDKFLLLVVGLIFIALSFVVNLIWR